MYCPVCNSEYRPGFTRCEPCGADLVPSLDAGAAPAAVVGPGPSSAAVGPFGDYCGFLDLDEARRERDRLREHRILARISIRESPTGDLDGPVREEYWLRVPVAAGAAVERVLGYDAAAPQDDGTFNCSACGGEVGDGDDACPRCGARFEDGP